ncbi:MAG TPA: EAL domain-containing protein, partial [Azospira sp.]|nr:EAL domain-containing protein [Azospira sp.]
LLSEMALDIGFALDRIDLLAQQQKLAAAIRESEEKYRAVVTGSLDGFWLMGSQGRLLEVNEAYVQFSGYSRAELLQMTLQDLEGVRSPEDITRQLDEVMGSGAGLFESRHQTRHGELKPVEVSITYLPEQGGLFSVFLRDLSMREAAEARISHLSHYDALTGLPNRTLFADRFGQALGQARRSGDPLSLVFLDIDHFKNINDVLGHSFGDRLLVELTLRLQRILRAEDTVSRQGGDEFLLLLPHANAESVAHIAEKLLDSIAEQFVIGHHELVVTASLGIALYPNDGGDFETLLRKADTAANWAKQQGRNTYRFFAPDMQAQSHRVMQLETALRRALERQELLLHYQPQVHLQSGAVVGVEALIRWNHPEQGLISPAEFIPIAESSGLILPIGRWVLETALRQLKAWMDQGLPLSQVAVNLSAIQFRQVGLPTMVQDLLAAVGLPASCLELELTESVMMENPGAAIRMLEMLHNAGVRISIDDFGTGYSSLSYLKRIRVDKLKIDQSFIRDLARESEDGAIIQAIISLAQTLNFTTIAEGVETEAQLDFLRTHRCDEIQGYLFSRPLPPEKIPEWLQRWRRT